jgi:hypothetical protein
MTISTLFYKALSILNPLSPNTWQPAYDRFELTQRCRLAEGGLLARIPDNFLDMGGLNLIK